MSPGDLLNEDELRQRALQFNQQAAMGAATGQSHGPPSPFALGDAPASVPGAMAPGPMPSLPAMEPGESQRIIDHLNPSRPTATATSPKGGFR